MTVPLYRSGDPALDLERIRYHTEACDLCGSVRLSCGCAEIPAPTPDRYCTARFLVDRKERRHVPGRTGCGCWGMAGREEDEDADPGPGSIGWGSNGDGISECVTEGKRQTAANKRRTA